MWMRHISAGDWAGIVAMEAAAYGGHTLSEQPAALVSRAVSSPSTCFVLDAGDRLAGYLISLPYPDRRYPDLAVPERVAFRSRGLHLHDLVVAPGFRGVGLAGRLLDRLARTAEAQAYERISLIAVAGSDTFWSARGFHARPGVVLSPGYGGDAVYMSRPIVKPDARALDAAWTAGGGGE